MSEAIEAGDHVYIGDGRVHWVVKRVIPSVNGRRTAYQLQSGMTGRMRTEVVGPHTAQLRLHSKGKKQ